MNRQSSRLRSPCITRCERVCIELPRYDQFCTVFAQPVQLSGRRYVRDKNLCGNTKLHRGVGDCCAVIAARGRRHTGGRYFARQKICESTACFERTRLLKQFELDSQIVKIEAKIVAIEIDNRRPADIRPDDRLDVSNTLSRNEIYSCWRHDLSQGLFK